LVPLGVGGQVPPYRPRHPSPLAPARTAPLALTSDDSRRLETSRPCAASDRNDWQQTPSRDGAAYVALCERRVSNDRAAIDNQRSTINDRQRCDDDRQRSDDDATTIRRPQPMVKQSDLDHRCDCRCRSSNELWHRCCVARCGRPIGSYSLSCISRAMASRLDS
jgi:hypothetical protein